MLAFPKPTEQIIQFLLIVAQIIMIRPVIIENKGLPFQLQNSRCIVIVSLSLGYQ